MTERTDLERLIHGLQHPEAHVRRLAAKYVYFLRGDISLAFQCLLDVAEKDKSEWAVRALGRIGDKRAIDVLIRLISQQGRPASAASEVLTNIGSRHITSRIWKLIQQIRTVIHKPIETFYAKSAILDFAYVMAELGDNRAGEILSSYLQNSDNPDIFRITAATGLGLLGREDGIVELINMLIKLNPPQSSHHYGWNIKPLVSRALIRVGIPAVQPLSNLLTHTSKQVRADIVMILGRIRDINDPEVILRLKTMAQADKSGWVRREAAKSLRKLGYEPDAL